MDKWIAILKIIGPAVMMVVPGAQPFIPLVIAGIEVAEMSNKSGVEKRAIAMEAVELGAVTANTIAKKEVVLPIEASKVADDTIDAVVGATNLVSKIVENLKKKPTSPVTQ